MVAFFNQNGPTFEELEVRFKPILAEALEVLAGEHALTLNKLPRYGRIELTVRDVVVVLEGANRVEGASVSFLTADGKAWGGCLRYTRRKSGDHYTGEVGPIYPRRETRESREAWLAYQKGIEEGVAG